MKMQLNFSKKELTVFSAALIAVIISFLVWEVANFIIQMWSAQYMLNSFSLLNSNQIGNGQASLPFEYTFAGWLLAILALFPPLIGGVLLAKKLLRNSVFFILSLAASWVALGVFVSFLFFAKQTFFINPKLKSQTTAYEAYRTQQIQIFTSQVESIPLGLLKNSLLIGFGSVITNEMVKKKKFGGNKNVPPKF